MRKRILIASLVVLSLLILAFSFGAFSNSRANTVDEDELAPTNDPPTADAGGPYTVDEGKTVQLDGNDSSDPDGDSLTYSWTTVSGPVGGESLTVTGSPTPIFSAPSVDNDIEVTVELTVDDGRGHVDADTATVTVRNVPGGVFPAMEVLRWAVLIVVVVVVVWGWRSGRLNLTGPQGEQGGP